MSEKRKYDSTVARMAGNIAAGLVRGFGRDDLNRNDPYDWTVRCSVSLARAIIAEVERTEPVTPASATPKTTQEQRK